VKDAIARFSLSPGSTLVEGGENNKLSCNLTPMNRKMP